MTRHLDAVEVMTSTDGGNSTVRFTRFSGIINGFRHRYTELTEDLSNRLDKYFSYGQKRGWEVHVYNYENWSCIRYLKVRQ